jgi:hypothetical protein
MYPIIKENDMRTKLTKLILVLTLGVVICLPGVAGAITADGTVVADWDQQFNESGVGNFTSMEFFMVSGGSEWTKGAHDFGNGSWSGEIVNPDYAMATGNATTNMNFYLNGTDVGPPNVFSFDFLAWDGDILTGTLKEHVRATYNNGGWSFAASYTDVQCYDRTDPPPAVPLPPSVLLLGTGLLGLGLLPWRHKTEV